MTKAYFDYSSVNPFSSIFSKCPLYYLLIVKGHGFTLMLSTVLKLNSCQIKPPGLHFLCRNEYLRMSQLTSCFPFFRAGNMFVCGSYLIIIVGMWFITNHWY